MAGKHFVILLIGIILSSCAQVGIITGGDTDVHAPKPQEEKITPQNASVNFTGNEVIIPFDEYFQLKNPVQNIRMVPPHAKVNAKVKKKTLYLSWEEQLEPNTTYAIYLNNAVKDITEGNDTTIQYVFSTGAEIDTLSYSVPVIDAWTNTPVDNCVVALFEPDSNKLISFTKANNGLAELNYLRQGNYTLVAFNDENNNLEYDAFERVGFPETGSVSITQNVSDSIPLKMYRPAPEPGISALKTFPPCSFVIGSTHPLDRSNTEISVNDLPVHPFSLEWLAEDSILFFPGALESNTGKVVLRTSLFSDTTRYSVRPNDKEEEIKITPFYKKGVPPSEDIRFEINSFIYNVDSSMIHIMNMNDSSEITDFRVRRSKFSFEILLDKKDLTSLKFSFDASAFLTACGPTQNNEMTVELKQERDFGSLNINVSGYNEPIILDVLKGNDLIRSKAVAASETSVELNELEPGEYHFRVIRDANENGFWDVGDYKKLLQPETVDYYSKKTRVRANWTIDVSLTPNE